MDLQEQELKLIKNLWDNGASINAIAQMLPYKKGKSLSIIKELKQSGLLVGKHRKGKCTIQKVLYVYENQTKNPYEIAKILSLSLNTVKHILSYNIKDKRERPKHNYKKRKKSQVDNLSKNTQEIIRLLKENLPCAEIAKRLTVSRQYVYAVKRKFL